jgi:prepilin-type N-terminal cleavage/methylation domain-containing protein
MLRDLRRGMTLIELMLAITLGGMLLLGARMLFTQLQVADVNLGRAAREGDERANATRLLHALVRNADVKPDSVDRFVGDTASARFRSQCQRPGDGSSGAP